MSIEEEIVRIDGRRLAVHVVAEGTGPRTVVMCHAAPGAGSFDPDPDATPERGVTLIGVDRPGYGGSDPVSGDQWAGVDRAADDLGAVLDQLDTGPVGVAVPARAGRLRGHLPAVRAGPHGRPGQDGGHRGRVPGAGHLLVIPTWRRVLSHLAPQRRR